MAMPSSGCIALRTCITGCACSSISCAVAGTACSPASLSSLSVQASKGAPHCMREFYGYTSASPLSLSTTSCSQGGLVGYHCGVIVGMSTVGHYATLSIRYNLRGSSAKGSCAAVCLVCNGITVCTCIITATAVLQTGTWSEYIDYNDNICFVTKTDTGLVLVGDFSITEARLTLEGITQGSGSYSIGSPDNIHSISSTL